MLAMIILVMVIPAIIPAMITLAMIIPAMIIPAIIKPNIIIPAIFNLQKKQKVRLPPTYTPTTTNHQLNIFPTQKRAWYSTVQYSKRVTAT